MTQKRREAERRSDMWWSWSQSLHLKPGETRCRSEVLEGELVNMSAAVVGCVTGFLTYETTKSVVVKSWSVGITNRVVQLVIITYFVGSVWSVVLTQQKEFSLLSRETRLCNHVVLFVLQLRLPVWKGLSGEWHGHRVVGYNQSQGLW